MLSTQVIITAALSGFCRLVVFYRGLSMTQIIISVLRGVLSYFAFTPARPARKLPIRSVLDLIHRDQRTERLTGQSNPSTTGCETHRQFMSCPG